MATPPPRDLASRLRRRIDRARTSGAQGAAVLRILGRSGLVRALRPKHVARFARNMRGSKAGPHLAVMLHAQVRPDRLAVADGDRRLSYGEFDREVNQVAHALRRLGVGPGDRVAITLPNCVEFLVILQALPRIGASAVQIGARLKAGEIEYILGNARPRALIYHASARREVEEARARAGVPEAGALIEIGGDGPGYREIIAGEPGERPPAMSGRGADSSVIVYTSGTTGKPKGASRNLSRTGLDAAAELISRVGMSHEDRHLVVCPLYHSAAPAFALIMMSLGGSVIVLDHFDAEEVLATIARERITCAFMVPTQLVRLTALDPAIRARYDTSSLRWILSGAAPLTTETARRFQDAYGPILWNFYGATETGLVTAAGPEDHTARPGTVGRVLTGNRIRVLDESGAEVPTGEVGELYVSNSMLITGYHGDPDSTSKAMRDGFFSVGDLARVDQDGYVYLASRVHDMVISGGINIYPAEIEEHLHRHPEVLEAAVVGVPDDEWGERLIAFVVTRPGSALSADEVIQFCREGLADYKRPRAVEFMEALPRNPTGKVLKRELRAPRG
jgi:fatty-acyl-CoA synthase